MANAIQNAASTVTNAASHPVATVKKLGGYGLTALKIGGAAFLAVNLLAAFAPAAAAATAAGATATTGTTSTLGAAAATIKGNVIQNLPAATQTLTTALQGTSGFLAAKSAALSAWLAPTP